MNTLSTYVFRQALGPLSAILGALAAIAVLTQGLNQLDIIITNRSAGFAFAYVTLLTLPQLISLILPIAVFIAVIYALNRMRTDSEVAVMFSAGVTRGRIARPIIQLAVLAALAHLVINVLIQPWTLEQRREVFYSLRNDFASSLIQEGEFTYPSDKLTLYARARGGSGELRDLLINDARPKFPITYTARTGAIVTIDGKPAIVMRDGQAQRMLDDGTVNVLDFDRYAVPLGGNFQEPANFYLKGSDRDLHDLIFPDLTSHYDQLNIPEFLSEAHQRLSAPLLNIALAMIALVGVLVGEHSRQGYARRIILAAIAAALVRLAAIAISAAAVADPKLNALQYVLPIVVTLFAASLLSGRRSRRRRHSLGPTVLAEA